MRRKNIIVGIDLGYYNARVNYFDENEENGERFKPIRFSNQSTSLPLYVDFNYNPVKIGVKSENAIFGMKRFIGLNYDDPKVQEEMKNGNYPFEIVKGEKRSCSIKFQIGEKNIKISPEEIMAILLRYIKNEIIKYLNVHQSSRVNAVITIPYDYTEEQQTKLTEAAEMAGIYLISLLPEPIAAVHKIKGQHPPDGYYYVFDLGKDKFIGSCIQSERYGRDLRCIATIDDNQISGNIFDINFENIYYTIMGTTRPR